MCPVFFQTNTFRRTFSKPESKNLGKSVKKKRPRRKKKQKQERHAVKDIQDKEIHKSQMGKRNLRKKTQTRQKKLRKANPQALWHAADDNEKVVEPKKNNKDLRIL